MTERVRRLDARARPAMLVHLLALDADDRYGRFGSALRDPGIRALVARLDFERDLLLGVEDGDGLIGLAYVGVGGVSDHGLAELALSVAPSWRRRGVARALFAHAARRVAGQGIAGFACIHGHPATLRIARGLGLPVRLSGGEPRAVVALSVA